MRAKDRKELMIYAQNDALWTFDCEIAMGLSEVEYQPCMVLASCEEGKPYYTLVQEVWLLNSVSNKYFFTPCACLTDSVMDDLQEQVISQREDDMRGEDDAYERYIQGDK